MRVLVLGAGPGGLELTTRLSDECGDQLALVLTDERRASRVKRWFEHDWEPTPASSHAS